ncbi:MAG: ParA family protein [Alphaproteobacteria bacterium]|nr:ParA family protein [Alphaproteobacteria bacterium]
MRTLSLLAQKGGVGKTALAVHLAILAESLGERVALIATNPQESAATTRPASRRARSPTCGRGYKNKWAASNPRPGPRSNAPRRSPRPAGDGKPPTRSAGQAPVGFAPPAQSPAANSSGPPRLTRVVSPAPVRSTS